MVGKSRMCPVCCFVVSCQPPKFYFEIQEALTVGLITAPAVKRACFPVSLTQWNSKSRACARKWSGSTASKLCTNLVEMALKMSIGATSRISVSLWVR